jgi:phytanoyl-CoA hydroxylase
MGLEQRTFLPKQGDVVIWSADLAHGGSPVTDPLLTRRSIVGHYCPNRVEPFYFNVRADRRSKRSFQGSLYSSLYYALSD